jgi:hypothetical protein
LPNWRTTIKKSRYERIALIEASGVPAPSVPLMAVLGVRDDSVESRYPDQISTFQIGNLGLQIRAIGGSEPDTRFRDLRKVREKIFWRNRERLCQLHDVFQRHIPLTTLHAANIIAVQPRPFGQLLLRVAALVTEFP